MLQSLLSAHALLGQDPAPLLADLATSLGHSQEVRHLAAQSLGEHPSPRGRQALESLMVESSGNNYLRVRACQSLLSVAPREEFCAKVAEVLDREVDAGFVRFLISTQEANCR